MTPGQEDDLRKTIKSLCTHVGALSRIIIQTGICPMDEFKEEVELAVSDYEKTVEGG